MDARSMLCTAIVLLALAALGGLTMAVIRFRGADRPPGALAMGHGLLAAAALTLLIYAASTSGLPPMAVIGTGILVVVALVGTWLNLSYHAKMLPLPKGPVVVHGIAAVVGFVLLLIAASAGAEEAQIYGRWRALETRVQLADGTTNKQTAACTAEYAPSQTISECEGAEGRKTRVVAKLYNVTPSSYEIEV